MHYEVLSPEGLNTLTALKDAKLLHDFYLAGGTALALQLGHRRSIDFDWFTADAFEPGLLLAGLQGLGEVNISQQSPGTLHVVFQSTRLSFFQYPYPLVEPLIDADECRLAGPIDIGLMKLSAIANRGSKKDFYDLYRIASRIVSLDDLFRRLPEKFPRLKYSTYHLLRSLAYFDDAEHEPEPMLLQPIAWETVTAFFRRAQRDMMRKYEE